MKKVPTTPGVLSAAQIRLLLECGAVTTQAKPDLDASALDLPIGSEAWLLSEAQRPATRELNMLKRGATVIPRQSDATGPYFELERRKIYLLQLEPYLKLPANINGRATGKSSIGRLDVITRLLTNDGTEYDVVRDGYDGQLFLLVLPQTFTIRVSPGQSLNQLRFFCGPPTDALVTKHTIGDYGAEFWHVLDHTAGQYESWDGMIGPGARAASNDPTMFDMTVDLNDPLFPHIYKARSTATSIDLRGKRKGVVDPSEYFEKVSVSAKAPHSVVIEQGAFYIMKSRERLCIPRDVAVEVVAISERIGDIRIHYAGFAHPGFGQHENTQRRGTPLIFEVRATDMPTRLYDGSLLARMQLFRMSTRARRVVSAYDEQELKLSSVFKEPGS